MAPAWSPDGKLIAYAVHPLGGGSPQIYTMHPDGTNVTLRTSDYGWNGGRNPELDSTEVGTLTAAIQVITFARSVFAARRAGIDARPDTRPPPSPPRRSRT